MHAIKSIFIVCIVCCVSWLFVQGQNFLTLKLASSQTWTFPLLTLVALTCLGDLLSNVVMLLRNEISSLESMVSSNIGRSLYCL